MEARVSDPVSPLPPLRIRLSIFALWGILVGIVFFTVYPATNWLTGLNSRHFSLFLSDELHIPLLPEFIWLYLSMYVLFFLPPFYLAPAEIKRLAMELIIATLVAGVMFLLLPARLGFSRTLPADELYRDLFGGLFYLDAPYNLVPSLHVVYSVAIILAVTGAAGKCQRALLFTWLVLIVSSTVLVHQHHLLDVFSGLALVVLVRYLRERKND